MDIDGNLRLLVRAESVIGTTDPGTNGETEAPLDLESSADWEPDQQKSCCTRPAMSRTYNYFL